jgi:hypothetical protein
VDASCDALANPNANVCANAVTALGTFGADSAGACLDRAAADPVPFLRTVAEDALRRRRP